MVDKLARGKNHSDQMEPQIVTKGGYGRSGAAGRENSALLLALREQRGEDLLKKKIMMKNTHTHTRADARCSSPSPAFVQLWSHVVRRLRLASRIPKQQQNQPAPEF